MAKKKYVLVCAECDARFEQIEDAFSHQEGPLPTNNFEGHGGFDVEEVDE